MSPLGAAAAPQWGPIASGCFGLPPANSDGRGQQEQLSCSMGRQEEQGPQDPPGAAGRDGAGKG